MLQTFYQRSAPQLLHYSPSGAAWVKDWSNSPSIQHKIIRSNECAILTWMVHLVDESPHTIHVVDNPQNSYIWRDSPLKALTSRMQPYKVDMCRFCLKSSNDLPLLKRTLFMSTHKLPGFFPP